MWWPIVASSRPLGDLKAVRKSDLQVQRNAEHHQSKDDVQDRQRGGIEMQLDLVDGQHGVSSLWGPDLFRPGEARW
jgi:hypothetical protein